MLPNITFKYMVYQPNPSKDSIHYWIDGESVKRYLKIDDFIELVNDIDPVLNRVAYESCRTYSFYLYSPADNQITHLNPISSKKEEYFDSKNLSTYAANPNKYLAKTKTTLSIEEALLSYGFEFPTESNIKNLKVNMTKDAGIERQLTLQSFLNLFKRKERTN